LQTNNTKAIEITRDAKEKETRALWKKDADEANAKIKMGNLNDAEVDKLKAAAKLASQQATAPAASDDAKIGRYLTVPSGVGMWNFLALTFCLMVGTAGLPHILTRYYTHRRARGTDLGGVVTFYFLLYFTAPAYPFARFVIYAKLVGTQIADLPAGSRCGSPPASST
jgi:cation/acetate symporter